MLQNLTGWHALIILAIVVLVFGAAKLPALARSVGQSLRILKSEVAEPQTAASAPGSAVPADPGAIVAGAATIDPVRPTVRPGE